MVGATFADTATERAVRIAPTADAHLDARESSTGDTWETMLVGYQLSPSAEPLHVEPVDLATSLATLISRPGLHRPCGRCGEEIMNEREVMLGDVAVCRGCAGERYYSPLMRPE